MRSCLTIIVIIILGVVVFRMYQKSQQPYETPELTEEYSPDFKQAVLNRLTPLSDINSNIDYINLDGSILDLHYRRPVSKAQFRDDASAFAAAFSNEKKEQLGRSDVIVRCIYQNLIRVEVSAENGRVVGIQEL